MAAWAIKSASWLGSCDSASAAFIMSAPMKIMKIMPLVTAVVRIDSTAFCSVSLRCSSVMMKVSVAPMAAPSVGVKMPP